MRKNPQDNITKSSVSTTNQPTNHTHTPTAMPTFKSDVIKDNVINPF